MSGRCGNRCAVEERYEEDAEDEEVLGAAAAEDTAWFPMLWDDWLAECVACVGAADDDTAVLTLGDVTVTGAFLVALYAIILVFTVSKGDDASVDTAPASMLADKCSGNPSPKPACFLSSCLHSSYTAH